MNYMWEALLEGTEQGLEKEDIHFNLHLAAGRRNK